MSLTNERAHATRVATRRVPRREVCLEGFGEEELEIIEWYNDMLGDWGEGWLPVNRFSTAVQAAIADWLADFRATTREDLYQLLILAESGSDDVNIPKKRTLVRLLRENTRS